MKYYFLFASIFAALVLTVAIPADEKKAVDGEKNERESNKQDKRGLFDFGYGHGGFDVGDQGGIELGGVGHDFGALEDHGHVKQITIHKTIKVPVPHPIPYPVVKKVAIPVPFKVPVPVDRPYPVHIPKPYPVPVEKLVPYPVEKPVPYPVKVPVKVHVPYPVAVPYPKPVPYAVHKPVPYPVKVPYVVEKKVPVFIKAHHDHGLDGLDGGVEHDFGSHDFGGHDFGGHDLGSGFDLHQ